METSKPDRFNLGVFELQNHSKVMKSTWRAYLCAVAVNIKLKINVIKIVKKIEKMKQHNIANQFQNVKDNKTNVKSLQMDWCERRVEATKETCNLDGW